MEGLSNGETWAALFTLTAMEIVLGIDNIIFIALLAEQLPEEKQKMVRLVGLGLAMISRIALLASLAWVMGLTKPIITIGTELSGRDILLLVGGLFLIAKATKEIHKRIEGEEELDASKKKYPSVVSTLIQIMLLDIVFSLDSVITAVGMANQLWVMIVAIVIAVIIMMVFAEAVSKFIHDHPTIKMLALSFLLLIGVFLVAESIDHHINKNYIYAAITFSLFVEALNIASGKKKKVVEYH